LGIGGDRRQLSPLWKASARFHRVCPLEDIDVPLSRAEEVSGALSPRGYDHEKAGIPVEGLPLVSLEAMGAGSAVIGDRLNYAQPWRFEVMATGTPDVVPGEEFLRQHGEGSIR